MSSWIELPKYPLSQLAETPRLIYLGNRFARGVASRPRPVRGKPPPIRPRHITIKFMTPVLNRKRIGPHEMNCCNNIKLNYLFNLKWFFKIIYLYCTDEQKKQTKKTTLAIQMLMKNNLYSLTQQQLSKKRDLKIMISR